MPAWITPELCVLVSMPGRGCRSSRQIVRSGAAIARAAASPTTPPPMMATSTVTNRDISYATMPAVVTVPLLDLRAQYAPLREAVLAAITRVCDSQRFIMGPEVDALEREVASMLGVRHAIGVSSGTDALMAALMALKIGRGDEVVTSPYAFFATPGSIARLGARPVFVDIDPDTFNLDVSLVEAACTPATKAIIPVHLFGLVAPMPPLMDVARRRRLRVVEDAAQAIGAHRDGRFAGAVGDIGCFSFYPTKNLGAFGDAGLVTTNDDELGHALRIIRLHGSEPKYFHKVVGGNFRIDALQAAVLRVKAPYLAGWTEGRRRNAGTYRALMDAAGAPTRPHLAGDAPR